GSRRVERRPVAASGCQIDHGIRPLPRTLRSASRQVADCIPETDTSICRDAQVGLRMRDAGQCVVIAGASGFVGGAVARELAVSGWRVVGLSRRPPAEAIEGVEHTPLDLRNAADCRRVAATLAGTTHLVYAAVNETPGDLVS